MTLSTQLYVTKGNAMQIAFRGDGAVFVRQYAARERGHYLEGRSFTRWKQLRGGPSLQVSLLDLAGNVLYQGRTLYLTTGQVKIPPMSEE